MMLVLVLFIIMVLIVFVVQVVVKAKAKKAERQELEKAILRMTDVWFKKYCEGWIAKNWVGIHPKIKRLIYAELKRRNIDINKL